MAGGDGNSPASGWKHLVAGGVAGSTAVLFLHPFDVVKTRLQVQDGVPGALTHYRGTLDAIRTILRTEGWVGLYAGLTPSLIGSGISWGAYLYLYERIKAWHRARHKVERLSALGNLLSAAQSGALVCLLTNPIWLVKTRLALQQRGSAAAAGGAAAAAVPYRGMRDAMVRIAREDGLRGLYKGLGPSLVLQTMHGAVQFAAYEELKGLAARLSSHSTASTVSSAGGSGSAAPAQGQLSSLQVSACGALSKLLAAVSTYPTQVVRSRVQQRFDTGRALVYNSPLEAVRVTWAREGLRGFYKGLLPSLLRVMPQSAITLVAYENLLAVMAAEGSAMAGTPPQAVPASHGREVARQGGSNDGGVPPLSDSMAPLVIAADSQAEN